MPNEDENAAAPSAAVDTYVRVHLDTDRLDATRIEDTLSRLHRLRSGQCLEVRLVADGTVRYYIGTAEPQSAEIEDILHTLFPDGTSITHESPPPLPDESDAALTVRGRGDRRDDWQTRLRPVTTRGSDRTRFPLAGGIDALASAEATVHYQALLVPKPDWRADASLRRKQLRRNRDTTAQRLIGSIMESESPPSERTADRSHQQRIDSIEAIDPKHTFSVYARAVADGPDAASKLASFGDALTVADGEFYAIDPLVHRDTERVTDVAEKIETGTPPEPPSLRTRLTHRLPITSNADPEIVASALTAPNFWLVDGDSLTSHGRRAMEATPDERTGVPRPEDELLEQYDSGMLLGHPLTDDDEPIDEAIALPPSLQPLHAAWFGKTGSGKSTALINAMLDNHGSTEGADIVIDPKGDGMPTEYLKAHYARHGDLEDVYYFDCAETLPALSFFDIRDQLADGIDRTTAVEDVTDHYVELLIGAMGRDRFERAVRSPDIIRYLVKAMFDPVHGADAFAHSDLQDAVTRMRDTRDAPPVVDPELQRMLSGVAANSDRSFDELMQGVANRIEKIPLDDRLGQLFNHVPGPDDAQFDFREIIDEDAIVILDTGALRPESRRVITLALLSQLWTALRRRKRVETDADGEADLPLVNLYLEEAASVASSGLVSELLAQSRAFELSVTLAMQFPAQLRQADSEAYAEVLNNVSTVVTGNVAVDADLKKRLATESMPPDEVANRLRALRRGQWFVSLPSAFGTSEPRPFLVESSPIPAGHPESDAPLSSARRTAFEAAFDAIRDRTRLDHGIDLVVGSARGGTHGEASVGSEGSGSEDDPSTETHPNSVLAHTNRMPDAIAYDEELHALVCSACESRYEPTAAGIERAIDCCHSLDEVDRDDIPVCSVSLKLSANERAQSRYSDAQLRFLQVVYAAHQRQFDPDLEYDLLNDSMVRLREYAGAEKSAVDELLEDGLLVEDCQHPHVLYTVTAEGRTAAKIRHREGVAHGDGKGDLNESSFHVAMVELGRRYVHEAFVDDSESAAVEVKTYYAVGDGRLDVVGLDADGEVVVALEAERSNHDALRAVPDDYDKMARQKPEAAIWIVENRDGGHDVLEALNEPAEGEPRVEKTYSRGSPPQRFSIDEPGFTEMHTFSSLRNSRL